MNDTQKGAWFMLGMTLFSLSLFIYLAFAILIAKQIPQGKWLLPAFCVLLLVQFFFIRKKQSDKEVAKDERDIIVQKNAAMVSFFSVWPLLFALVSAAMWFFGTDGSVPTYLLPIVSLCMMFVAFVIYAVAVLVQYREN